MKSLAQSPASLGEMVEAAAKAPEMVARCLERADAALFSRLKGERFGGGPRFVAIRVDRRTVVTTVGAVAFKRRYYRDESTGRYCHPLDDAVGLSRRSRLSDEMRVRVFEAAGQMSYSKAAEWASPTAPISKATVARVVADVEVRAVAKAGKVHVQIDEKYIAMGGDGRKARYVTAAIFDGVSSHGDNYVI